MIFGVKGRARSIEVVDRAPGGHAARIRVKLEGSGVEKVVEANRGFRHKLGTRKIRSTLITKIQAGPGGFVIHGRGWGHAAGMCQWGAYGMSRAGKDAVAILEHYFPGARVRRLY
jgi:stage II sporulation protein D